VLVNLRSWRWPARAWSRSGGSAHDWGRARGRRTPTVTADRRTHTTADGFDPWSAPVAGSPMTVPVSIMALLPCSRMGPPARSFRRRCARLHRGLALRSHRLGRLRHVSAVCHRRAPLKSCDSPRLASCSKPARPSPPDGAAAKAAGLCRRLRAGVYFVLARAEQTASPRPRKETRDEKA